MFRESLANRDWNIDLIIRDAKSNPVESEKAARELIEKDGVVAIIGDISTGTSIPIGKVCLEKKIPLIAVGATRDDLTELGRGIFRVCYTDTQQATAMARFAFQEKGRRSLAVFTDTALPYSTHMSEVFIKSFTSLGGKIADQSHYTNGTTDFKKLLLKAKEAKSDGIYCSGYFTEAGLIGSQRVKHRLNVPLFGSDGFDSQSLIETIGKGARDVYFTVPYSGVDPLPMAQRFRKGFVSENSKPPSTAMAALGFDAANLLFAAIKKTTPLNSDTLITNLYGTTFNGATGELLIEASGNAAQTVLVQTIDDGRFVPVMRVRPNAR